MLFGIIQPAATLITLITVWQRSVGVFARFRSPRGIRLFAAGRGSAIMFLAIACSGGQTPAFAAMESMNVGTIGGVIDPQLPNRTPKAVVGPEGPAVRTHAANPLWAVPLRVLTETRDRPLFSPSRRPPPAAVAAAPAIAPVRPKARPAAPDHPLLTLIGTVVGDWRSIAIFFDQASKSVIRLRTGQDHDGWTLRAIHERDVVLENPPREAILALPARSANDQSVNSAGNPAQAPASGTWMDGDGQLISPPTLANGAQPWPSARQPVTWRDGDGRLITPPARN